MVRVWVVTRAQPISERLSSGASHNKALYNNQITYLAYETL